MPEAPPVIKMLRCAMMPLPMVMCLVV